MIKVFLNQSGGIALHNLFSDLQGGQANEYYHLTSEKNSWLAQDLRTTASPMFDGLGVGTTHTEFCKAIIRTATNHNLLIRDGAAAYGGDYADGIALDVLDNALSARKKLIFAASEILLYGSSSFGVGTSTPVSYALGGWSNQGVFAGDAGNGGIVLQGAAGLSLTALRFATGTGASDIDKGFVGYDFANARMYFGVDRSSRMWLAAAGLGLGTTSFGTSAAKVLAIGSGTAPSTSPADSIQMWSADIIAGNAAPHFRTEGGAVIKLYQQAHIVDADGTLADITTKFNTLLVYLENLGFNATA